MLSENAECPRRSRYTESDRRPIPWNWIDRRRRAEVLARAERTRRSRSRSDQLELLMPMNLPKVRPKQEEFPQTAPIVGVASRQYPRLRDWGFGIPAC